jgi:hypothetical protein
MTGWIATITYYYFFISVVVATVTLLYLQIIPTPVIIYPYQVIAFVLNVVIVVVARQLAIWAAKAARRRAWERYQREATPVRTSAAIREE